MDFIHMNFILRIEAIERIGLFTFPSLENAEFDTYIAYAKKNATNECQIALKILWKKNLEIDLKFYFK